MGELSLHKKMGIAVGLFMIGMAIYFCGHELKLRFGGTPKEVLTVAEITDSGTEPNGRRTGYWETAILQDSSGQTYRYKFHKSMEFDLPGLGSSEELYIVDGKPEIVQNIAFFAAILLFGIVILIVSRDL